MTTRLIGTVLAGLFLLLVPGTTNAVERSSALEAAPERPSLPAPVLGEIEETEGPTLRTVPTMMPFQGYLTDTSGTPVGIGGSVPVRFTVMIYDASVGGALQWGPETHIDVPVTDGVFTLELGSLSALPLGIFGPGPLWLEIVADGTFLSPRTQLLCTPFAMRAGIADVADVAIADDGDWTQSGSNVYRLTGNVGVGVSAPMAKLHMNGRLRIDTAGNETIGTITSGNVQYFQFRDGGTASQLGTIGGSNTDGAGFAFLNSPSGATNVELDADGDDSGNGVEEGLIRVRSRGTGGTGGAIQVENNDGADRVTLNGGGSGEGGQIDVLNESGVSTIIVNGDSYTGSEIRMYDDAGTMTVDIDSDYAGDGCNATFSDANGLFGVTINGGLNDGGGLLSVFSTGATITLDGAAADSSAEVRVKSNDHYTRVILDGDDYGGGLIELIQEDHVTSGILLRGEEFSTGDNGSVIEMFAEDGTETIELDSGFGTGTGWLFVDGSIVGDSKSALVKTKSGEQRLMYCTEAPEHWFEDVGSGQLHNGVAEIALDPLYLETVTIDGEHPMRVIVTPTAKCNGVYVEKGSDRFVVRELLEGSSSATFDYKVVCKRKGYEDERLELFVKPGNDDPFDPGNRTRIRPADPVVPGVPAEPERRADGRSETLAGDPNEGTVQQKTESIAP